MEKNKSISAAIGEYLVLGELLKRNIEAYLAHGATQKGWDIAILKDHHTKRVQVKTIDWPNEKAVNGKLTEGFDFLVVVLLNKKMPRSRFFIFDVKDLEPLISKPNIERKNNSRTLTMSQRSMTNHLSKYEDNWKIFLQPVLNINDIV